MHYICDQCGHTIGAMLDAKGRPEMFKCHRTGAAAKAIQIGQNKPVKIGRFVKGKKRKETENAQS